MNVVFALLIPLLILILIILGAIVRIVREYERGVVFRLGRLMGPRGPGLILLVPFIERMQRIDLRTVTLDIPSQEVITRDNVTVRVNAVAYFRVVDPNAAIINVTDYNRATSQIAQTTLRSVLGQSSLDDLLSERETINARLQQIIDEQTEPWGVKVSIVEVKDIELPQTMQRAMAQQAEAEREKRAKIIRAEGEFLASQQLADAAGVIAENPIALQLRYLQTVAEIGTENSTSIVFPIPIDMLNGLIGGFTGKSDGNGNDGTPPPGTPTITVLEPRPGSDEPRS